MAQSKKINVADGGGQPETIEIKEGDRFGQEEKEKIDHRVERVYSEEMGMLEKPTTLPKKFIWLSLLFSLFFGFIAGIFGGFFILTSDKISLPFLKEISLKQYFPTREITLTTEKKVTITEDLRLAELAQSLPGQMAKTFLAKTSVSGESPLLEQFYSPAASLGSGFVLTNDGWLVFAKKSFPDLQKDYIVTLESKLWPVDKIVFDPASEVAFVKTKANNLAAAKMTSRDEITAGQQVVILGPDGGLFLDKISQPHYREIKKSEDLIYSTDRYTDWILLSDDLPDKLVGSPVFALDKSIIGLAVSKTLIRPSYQFSGVVPLVLENKKIIRPYLGINYLNLPEIIGLSDSRFKDFNYGAVVFNQPAKTGPAAKAGLAAEDLIIKVGGLPVGNQYRLVDLIQDHRPGDAIEMIFVRDGKEKTVKITLEGR